MNGALVFLLVRSVRGRIIRAARLLKQPKYFIGVGAFVAWMLFTVGMPLFFDDDSGKVNVEFANAELLFEVMGEALPALQLVVALMLALLVSLWWLVPWSRLALDLTEAEIHMLTPMPLKRRDLMQYATLKSQPGILFGCTIMTIFLGSGGLLKRAGWFVAFWVVLTLWNLHSKGRALWLERQKELPRKRAWRNRLLLWGGIAAYWIVLSTALAGLATELITLRPEYELTDYRTTFTFMRQTLTTYGPRLGDSLIGWMLLPFRWITAPLFVSVPGASTALKVTGILMPIVLLVVHNEWVVRSQAKFEEAALAHARRAATKKGPGARYWKTSLRSRRRVPFALPAQGAPEWAILWKNSLLVTRFSYRNLLVFGVSVIGLALILVAAVPFVHPVSSFILLFIGLMSMVITPLTGSQSYRNDLRADLTRLEMIRPWPIEGWKLFAAEVASPTVFALMAALFGAGLALAFDLYMTLSGISVGSIRGEDFRVTADTIAAQFSVPQPLVLPLVVLGVLPLVAALTCLGTSLQNLLVLLFPGWVQLGSNKPQGAAAFGQNMIMFLGLGLAGLVCLLPAALLVAIIVALQTFVFGVSVMAWEFPLFGVIGATPVFAVVALIVRAGGRAWDDLDASSEILEGSG